MRRLTFARLFCWVPGTRASYQVAPGTVTTVPGRYCTLYLLQHYSSHHHLLLLSLTVSVETLSFPLICRNLPQQLATIRVEEHYFVLLFTRNPPIIQYSYKTIHRHRQELPIAAAAMDAQKKSNPPDLLEPPKKSPKFSCFLDCCKPSKGFKEDDAASTMNKRVAEDVKSKGRKLFSTGQFVNFLQYWHQIDSSSRHSRRLDRTCHQRGSRGT